MIEAARLSLLREIMSKLVSVSSVKKALYEEIDYVRDLDVVQTIVDCFIDDAFGNITSDKPFFTVEYKPPENAVPESLVKKINSEIDIFIERTAFYDFSASILEDALIYGEYPVGVLAEPDKGIIEFLDIYKPHDILFIFRNAKYENALLFKGRNEGYKVLSKDTVIPFIFAHKKIRLSLEENDQNIPEYIRSGRSIIYSALPKLKRMKLYETVDSQDDIRRLLTPTLVSVAIPDEVSVVEDIKTICKWYEDELNDNAFMIGAVDPIFDELEKRALFNASRLKVMPQFSSGKGALQSIDIQKQDPLEFQNKMNEMKNAIAYAIGILPQYLGIEGSLSRTDALKIYAKYSRRLAQIQYSFVNFVKRVVLMHLNYIGDSIDATYLEVSMRELLDVSLLDNVEYMVVAAQALNDIVSFFDGLNNSSLNLKVKSEKIKEILEKSFMGLSGFNDFVEVKKESEEGEGEEEFGGGGLGGGHSLGGGGGSVGGGTPSIGEPLEEPSGPSGGGGGEEKLPF